MTRRHSAALALLAALALGGCKLASFGEADVSLELLSPALSRGRFTVVMRSADASEGTLYVDGVAQPGPLLPGEPRELDVGPDGVHRLRCRAMVAGRPYHSNDVEVTVDATPPRLLEATGNVSHTGGPLHVSARFDEPLAARSRVTTTGAIFLASIAGDTVTADGGPVVLDEPPWEVTVTVEAWDALGNRGFIRIARFVAPVLTVELTSPPPGAALALGDAVTIQGTWTPSVPIDLTLGGAPIAKLEPGVPNVVDLRAVPEGSARLGFDLPGYIAAPLRLDAVIDHTAPHASCAPIDPIGGYPRLDLGFRCTFDEPVTGVPDGTEEASSLVWHLTPAPSGGADTWTLNLTGTTDRAGNPLAPPRTFDFPFLHWLAPFGLDPIAVDGTVVLTRAAVLDARGAAGIIVEREAPGPVAPLEELWLGDGDRWFVTDGVPTGPARVPSGLVAGASGLAAWVAPDGAGGWGVDGICMGVDAPHSDPLPLQGVEPEGLVLLTPSEAFCGRTWLGRGTSGHGEAWVTYVHFEQVFTEPFVYTWQPFWRARRAMTDPARVAVDAAMEFPWVAMVEREDGGPALLRLAYLPGSFSVPLGDVTPALNRNPLVDAASPTLNRLRVVAWIEDGVALARMPLPAGGWSDPIVLNQDEAHPARALVLGPYWVAFVERHPDGDHIAARRLDHGTGRITAWADLVPGHDVASLMASGNEGLMVLWRDAGGAIRIRRHNH